LAQTSRRKSFNVPENFVGVGSSEHPQIRPQKFWRFFPLILTHLEYPHKNFHTYEISRVGGPLPDGEERVRITAPNPEIWAPKFFGEILGVDEKGKKYLIFFFLSVWALLYMVFTCAKFHVLEYSLAGDMGEKPILDLEYFAVRLAYGDIVSRRLSSSILDRFPPHSYRTIT